jgi:hypothetical protein
MGIAILQAIGSFAAGAIAWVILEFFGTSAPQILRP